MSFEPILARMEGTRRDSPREWAGVTHSGDNVKLPDYQMRGEVLYSKQNCFDIDDVTRNGVSTGLSKNKRQLWTTS